MKKLVFIFTIILLTGATVKAQDGLYTWYAIEASKKITSNLKFEITPELRFEPGLSLSEYIIESGLSYKVIKKLTVGGYYRYSGEEKKKGTQTSNRFAFDAKSGFDLNRLAFSFRLRYTNSTDNYNEETDHSSFFRYRIKIDYDIPKSKFEPFASVELFHNLKAGEISKTRYTGGLSYAFNKKNELSLYYRIQDFNAADDPTNHIIGVGYSIQF